LFDELHGIHRPTMLVATVEPWPRNEMLAYERELLGFYLTGHPLEAYSGHFDSPKITSISAAQRIEESSTVRLAGIVCSLEKKFTKKDGKPFAVIVLEDFTGQMELTAWDEVFADKGSLLNPGAVISVVARLTRRDDSIRAIINTLSPLKLQASLKPVRLRLARGKLTEGALPDILDAVRRFPGKRPLIIEIVNDAGVTFEIRASEYLAVGDESGLRNAVTVLGRRLTRLTIFPASLPGSFPLLIVPGNPDSNFSPMKTIFVTGGAGYIGSICVEQLLNGGYEVAVFDNLTEGHRKAVNPKAEFFQGDLADRTVISRAMSEVKPDAIMHFAANALVGESMQNPSKYFRNNVANGVNLLDAAVESGVKKFVFPPPARRSES
jgi:hypothetical protein